MNPKLAKPLTEVVANQTLIFCSHLLTTSALGSLMGYSRANLKNQLRKYLNSISQASEAIQTSNMQQPPKFDTIALFRWPEFPIAATGVLPGQPPAGNCEKAPNKCHAGAGQQEYTSYSTCSAQHTTDQTASPVQQCHASCNVCLCLHCGHVISYLQDCSSVRPVKRLLSTCNN